MAEIFAKEEEWKHRCFYTVLALFGRPRRLLDVGCGDGTLISLSSLLGIEAAGIEMWPLGLGNGSIITHDLREPLKLVLAYDLILCWEVGEHLPEESAPVLAQSLADHLTIDGHLIFTAAQPGQDGGGHINCQPKRWWDDKLYAAGLVGDPVLTERLRSIWVWAAGPLFWLPENAMVFKRR